MIFERRTLNECLQSVIDRRGVTPKKLGADWTSEGYRVFSANNVKSSGLQNLDEIRYVDEETYHKWMKNEIQREDILLTSEAPAGEVWLWNSNEKIVVGQRLYALRTKADVNPWYLAFYLQSKKGQMEILNKCSGSTVFGISAAMFDLIEVLLPDKDTQDKIANILKHLVEKINYNVQSISVLRGIVNTLFSYWFIQFDFPDENGQPYKSSGGKMVWNDTLKRDIPLNWNVINVGDIVVNHDSKRIPLKNAEREKMIGNIPYYGATGVMGYVNRAIFDGDFILLAEDGSVMTDDGKPILQRISGKTWVNNHAHVLEPSNGYHCRLLMQILAQIPVVKIKTGSIQAKITQDNLNKFQVVDIPDSIKQKANEIFDVIDEMLLHLEQEIEELSSLGDFLLPLLMSGQVTFKETEA